MRRKVLLILALLLACLDTAAAAVTIYPRWHWSGNSTLAGTCIAPPGTACTYPRLVPKSGVAPSFNITGRWSSAIELDPQRDGGLLSESLGYLANEGPYDGGLGSAWMTFIWLDELPTRTSSVIWWEGNRAASFVIALEPSGRIALTYGQKNAWRGRLLSTHRVGRKAWHHIAFVYEPVGNGIVRLLINGIEEASASLPLPGGPDQSPIAPVAVGTFSGRNLYDLKGMVDEVKLIQFSPAAEYLQAVRSEHGLHFRNRVLNDLLVAGRISPEQVDDFREPTFHSTSLLRAHVASFYTSANACQPNLSCPRPLDPLRPYPNGWAMSYVYPLFEQPIVYGADGVELEGRYNSLYLNLTESCADSGPGCGEAGRPRVTGYCGSVALTLWAVYKAFGYAARKYDFINAAEFDYTDSHTLTGVYVLETEQSGRFLLQDATFNVSGRVGSTYYSVEELVSQLDPPPALDDGGYSFFGSGPDGPSWTWSSQYWDYFKGLVSVYSTWQK